MKFLIKSDATDPIIALSEFLNLPPATQTSQFGEWLTILTMFILLVIIFKPFLVLTKVLATCSVVVPIFRTIEELSVIISQTFSAIEIFSFSAIACLEKWFTLLIPDWKNAPPWVLDK